ncbi:MAG: ATP-binding cassette domain-containing protein [Corynebacterium sp.]|nr:ATP-binding cassette domain-containing protein [Corynebacterium sp.]
MSNQLTNQTATETDATNLTDDSGGGAAILLENVTKQYAGNKPAVDQLTLEIPAGKVVMFVGRSGCGKTTTLKLINRLIEPSEGRIIINGEDVSDMNADKLRRNIGYVIQAGGLLPHLTVGANVAIVPKMLGWDKERIDARVDELLSMVSLDPNTYRNRYPKELSGGQQQRVGVARALAADPPVLLMDEPFGAVDPITRQRLQDELINIQSELGKTIVCVTHDFDEAAKLGDWIAVFDEGARIVQYDTPERILGEPADDFVADFIGAGAGLKQLNLARVGDAEMITPAIGHPGDDAAMVLKEVERLGHDHAVILDDNDRVLSWPTRKRLRRMTTITDYCEDDLPVVGVKSSLNDALDTMLVANSGAALVEGPRRKFLGVVNVEIVMNAITELRSIRGDEDTPLGNNEGDIPEEVVTRVGTSDDQLEE